MSLVVLISIMTHFFFVEWQHFRHFQLRLYRQSARTETQSRSPSSNSVVYDAHERGKTMRSADTVELVLFTTKTRVSVGARQKKSGEIKMPSVSTLAELRQHRSKFPEVFLSARSALEMEARARAQWSRGAPAGFERLKPSHGKSEGGMQIEERCKTRMPGRHCRGSRTGGFLVQPREASSWSRALPTLRSALRDLDAIKQMAIL